MQRPLILAAALAVAAAAAAAQDAAPGPVTDASGLASAARSLAEAGADRLMIRDLLDKELSGADGEPIGTIRDFVVIPGGRLAAAVVETPDGGRLPVPFQAVKLETAAEGALEATMEASTIADAPELKSLADALGL